MSKSETTTDETAPQYEHLEIVETMKDVSSEAAAEVGQALSGFELVENHTYDGYYLVKYREGGEQDE